MRSARIHQARGDLLLENLIEARLVATNARVNLIRPIRFRLKHQVRIGQERPRHGNQIRASCFQRLLTDAWHVQSIRGHQWNGD